MMYLRLKDSIYIKSNGHSDTIFTIDVDSTDDEILKFDSTSAFIVQNLKNKIHIDELCLKIKETYEEDDLSLIKQDVMNLLQYLVKLQYLEITS